MEFKSSPYLSSPDESQAKEGLPVLEHWSCWQEVHLSWPQPGGKEIVIFVTSSVPELCQMFISCCQHPSRNLLERSSILAAWDHSTRLGNTSVMSFSLLHGPCTQSGFPESCVAPNTSPAFTEELLRSFQRDDAQGVQSEAQNTPFPSVNTPHSPNCPRLNFPEAWG